jgi:hypothetical protein
MNVDDDLAKQPSQFRGDRNKQVEQGRGGQRPGMGEAARRVLRGQHTGRRGDQNIRISGRRGTRRTAGSAPRA